MKKCLAIVTIELCAGAPVVATIAQGLETTIVPKSANKPAQTTAVATWRTQAFGNSAEIFSLVHQHNRKQNQDVNSANINQYLRCCYKVGIQQQVQARNAGKYAAQQKSWVNDVGEQHYS